MKILLLGKYGQLGYELERALAPLGEVKALDYPEINLVQPDKYVPIVRAFVPQIIINATAYTAVDRAESETAICTAINAQAAGVLAEEAKRIGAALVHYSTDYVFDGLKGSPYIETDAPNPLGVYGQSKLAGEQAIQHAGAAHLILRTAWVYSLRRDSFVTKVLAWSRQQEHLRLVTDQVSNPTWCRMLAEASALVLAQCGRDPAGWLGERSGLYHLAGDGVASRLDWGEAILRLDPQHETQRTRFIVPALTEEFPTPARRPLFSGMDCSRFEAVFGLRLPPWEQALAMAMQDYASQQP